MKIFPFPNFLHGKETSQIHSTDIEKRAAFSSINLFHQHEHQNVVGSDASIEDESDVGEPKKSGDLNLDDFEHAISDYQGFAQGFLCHA